MLTVHDNTQAGSTSTPGAVDLDWMRYRREVSLTPAQHWSHKVLALYEALLWPSSDFGQPKSTAQLAVMFRKTDGYLGWLRALREAAAILAVLRAGGAVREERADNGTVGWKLVPGASVLAAGRQSPAHRATAALCGPILMFEALALTKTPWHTIKSDEFRLALGIVQSGREYTRISDGDLLNGVRKHLPSGYEVVGCVEQGWSIGHSRTSSAESSNTGNTAPRFLHADAALLHLDQRQPSLAIRELASPHREAIQLAIAKSPSRDARIANSQLRIVGLDGDLRVTTRDLHPIAQAQSMCERLPYLLSWFTAQHSRVSEGGVIPEALLGGAAVRSLAVLNNASRVVTKALDAASALTCEYTADLKDALGRLDKIKETWSSVVFRPVDIIDVFEIHRDALVANKDAGGAVTLASVGIPDSCTALTRADGGHRQTLLAEIEPSTYVPRTLVEILDWMASGDSTDAAAASILLSAQVYRVTESALRQQAMRAIDSEPWAAAALALFPTAETRKLIRQCKSRKSASILEWAGATIELRSRSKRPARPMEPKRVPLPVLAQHSRFCA